MTMWMVTAVALLGAAFAMTSGGQPPQGAPSSQLHEVVSKEYPAILAVARLSGPLTARPSKFLPDEQGVDTDWERRPADERLKEGVCRADAVVVGRPKTVQSFTDRDDLFVFTEYLITVEEGLRHATNGAQLRYVRPGGMLKRSISLTVRANSGYYPEIREGEKYLFLLRRAAGDVFVVAHPFDAFTLSDGAARVIDPGVFSASFREGLSAEQLKEWVRAASCGSGG